jgi:hypothetical protein
MSFEFQEDVNIFDNSINFELQCPECNIFFNFKNWIEVYLPCETCGDHWGLECPECHESFDHVRDSSRLENIRIIK